MSLSPDCGRFAELFGGDANGGEEQRFLESHAASCASCRAFAAMLSDVAPPEPLDELARRRTVNRALDAFASERTRAADRRDRRWKLIALAAGVVALVAVGAAVLRSPELVASRLPVGERGRGAFVVTGASVPAGAEVWLDGKDSGRRAPLTKGAPLEVAPGAHSVQLRVEGRMSREAKLVVTAGETHTIDNL